MRINKPVSLDISRLCQSKTVMYEFWYDYVKPKYGENTKLFYMDTESFIVQVKTEDILKKKIFLEYKHANQQCVDTFVLDLLILSLKVKVY